MKRLQAILTLLVLPLLVLLGCNEQKPAPAAGPSGSAGPGAAPVAKAGPELNLFAWSEYVPQDVIDGFTKETGIKVN